MKVTVTFKLTPETRGEMIDTFGATTRTFRETVEHIVAEHGFMGIPKDQVHLRWLYESGRWA